MKKTDLKMTRKSFEITKFKAYEESGKVFIEGYANTKGHPDRYGDIPTVMTSKRNFVYDVSDFRKNPVMLIDHRNSVSSIAGKFVTVQEDEVGLFIKAEFSDSQLPEIKHAREMYLNGYAKALSIGGSFMYEDESNPNLLTLAKIYEISLVAVPADPNSLVDAVPEEGKEAGKNKPEEKGDEDEKELKTEIAKVGAIIEGQKTKEAIEQIAKSLKQGE